MNFLNPLLLIGALGIGLPILAHLLNKHQFKQTDWAAMQFLNRAVNVRSRQIKLQSTTQCTLPLAIISRLQPFQKIIKTQVHEKKYYLHSGSPVDTLLMVGYILRSPKCSSPTANHRH